MISVQEASGPLKLQQGITITTSLNRFDPSLFSGFYNSILENVDIEEIVDENGDNRTVTSFVSGVSISVAAVDQLLDISISAPEDFKNLTYGLMGELLFIFHDIGPD